jgi:hypothetical protein
MACGLKAQCVLEALALLLGYSGSPPERRYAALLASRIA